MNDGNSAQVLPMLALLPDLYYFFGTGRKLQTNEIIPAISKSNIRISTLQGDFEISTDKTLSLTSLTVTDCSITNLPTLLNSTSMLKYLNIENLADYDIDIDDNVDYIWKFGEIKASHLKQLILDCSTISFKSLELLLKCFPNLKLLSIVSDNSHDLIDANQWQHLIESSLPLLRVFNFNFGPYLCDHSYDDMLIKFSLFQTDFWVKHHWYVNYVTDKRSTSLYTIPYTRGKYNEYLLTPTMEKYNSSLTNCINEFDNVKKLRLHITAIKNDSSYYFRNVQSLSFISNWNRDDKNDEEKLKIEQIEYLKTMVNLSNITKLSITEGCLTTSVLLFEILKQMPSISSIFIYRLDFIYRNHELCELLNRKIKILGFIDYDNDIYLEIKDLDWFFKTFSNIEELSCVMENLDVLLLILTNCSKLLIIKIIKGSLKVSNWLSTNASTSNVYFDYDIYADYYRQI
jgi:hypothetical protein